MLKIELSFSSSFCNHSDQRLFKYFCFCFIFIFGAFIHSASSNMYDFKIRCVQKKFRTFEVSQWWIYMKSWHNFLVWVFHLHSSHTQPTRLNIVLLNRLSLINLTQQILLWLGQCAQIVATFSPGVERFVEHVRVDVTQYPVPIPKLNKSLRILPRLLIIRQVFLLFLQNIILFSGCKALKPRMNFNHILLLKLSLLSIEHVLMSLYALELFDNFGRPLQLLLQLISLLPLLILLFFLEIGHRVHFGGFLFFLLI